MCDPERVLTGTVLQGDAHTDASTVTISINAEHFRPKFKAIIDDIIGWCNELHMYDNENSQKLEDALIQCLKDG